MSLCYTRIVRHHQNGCSDSCPLPLGKTEIIESESVLWKVFRFFDAFLMGVDSSG